MEYIKCWWNVLLVGYENKQENKILKIMGMD